MAMNEGNPKGFQQPALLMIRQAGLEPDFQYLLGEARADGHCYNDAFRVAFGQLREKFDDQLKPVIPKPAPVPPKPPAPPPQPEKKKRLRLVDPSRFQSETASTKRCIEWVARHLSVRGVKPEQCISPEAWGMMNWVRSSPRSMDTFWSVLYPKLLPNKQQIEEADAATEQNVKVLEFVNHWLDEYDKDNT